MHLVPDALSRMPQAQAVYMVWSCFIYNKSTHAQTDIHHAIPLHPDSIEDVMVPLRQEDPELNTIIYLKSGILPDDPVEAHHLDLERPRFSLVDGVLLHEDPGLPGRPQLVVAKQVQEQLV